MQVRFHIPTKVFSNFTVFGMVAEASCACSQLCTVYSGCDDFLPLNALSLLSQGLLATAAI